MYLSSILESTSSGLAPRGWNSASRGVTSARLVGDAVPEPQIDPLWPRFRDEAARRAGLVLSGYHRVGAGQSADE
jgi:hypothetical protein